MDRGVNFLLVPYSTLRGGDLSEQSKDKKAF